MLAAATTSIGSSGTRYGSRNANAVACHCDCVQAQVHVYPKNVQSNAFPQRRLVFEESNTKRQRRLSTALRIHKAAPAGLLQSYQL